MLHNLQQFSKTFCFVVDNLGLVCYTGPVSCRNGNKKKVFNLEIHKKGGVVMKIDCLKIEMALAENGLSKSQYARRCKISRQNLSTILRRGSCEPATAGKLANGLGVPVREIIEQ
ncbi:XRE family transcriptional regulator [Clostridiaceae bacterium]|nr:XRE family transcriptional regulator [Clostridiaceae bacterium]